MRRAVLYLRLSESDESSTSIARQEADLRARAEREGWLVVAVLTDDGLSGGKRRVKAQQALEMLRSGTADVLAVWKMDRWTRQGLSALSDVLEVLEARPDASFVADRDGLDSDAPTWDLHAGMLVAVAKMERDNTKTRVKSSIARLRREGRYAGGNLPYGYSPAPRLDGAGRVLVINEDEAAIVREAAARLLGGETIYSVTLDLNARRVPTRRDTTWSIQALRQVLTSDVILGRVKHDGQLLRGEDGLPLQVWPSVLDLETWTRVRTVLGADHPGHTRAPRRHRARVLSGLVTCGICRAPLYVRANGAGHAAYGCSARSNGRDCPGVSISASLVEGHVVETFLARVGDDQVFEEVVEIASNEAALADVERALQATARELTAEGADDVALMARMALLRSRRSEIRQAPRESTVQLLPTGQTYRQAWEASDDDGRRAILSASIAVLAVAKGRRGSRAFDPSRVVIVNQPPFTAGVSSETKTRWSPLSPA